MKCTMRDPVYCTSGEGEWCRGCGFEETEAELRKCIPLSEGVREVPYTKYWGAPEQTTEYVFYFLKYKKLGRDAG